MNDELTEVDIKKMQEEIEHRLTVVRPKILDAVNLARSYGDLSENYEYKVARQDLRQNDSRVRYLQNMINTAKIVTTDSKEDEVGLFDKVTVYVEEDDGEETYQLTTTLRQDALEGRISNKSPLGAALMGHKVGDRLLIHVDDKYSYYIVIRKVEKGIDDETMPITQY